jgi:hypothetical protein
MKRLLLAVMVLTGMTDAGWARTVEQQLLNSLQKQGYVVLEQGYTFLGRLRIVAENGQIHREIVVNPGTGEILRDYAVVMSRSSVSKALPGQPAVQAVDVAAAAPDTGVTDAGVTDAGSPDTGSPDTGSVDTSSATDDGTTTPVDDGGTTAADGGPPDDGTNTTQDGGSIQPPDAGAGSGDDDPMVYVPDSMLQMAPGTP